MFYSTCVFVCEYVFIITRSCEKIKRKHEKGVKRK
nr:MAG TPA: hypothetical protein [Caudoviricetes sp.]